MNREEFKKILYTKERGEKISQRVKEWYLSGSENAEKARERIRNLRPMRNPESLEKMKKAKKGQKFVVRGGNGKGPTVPQKILYDALSGEWEMEHVIALGRHKDGYPTNYKIDIAHPILKIAIEVDGYSHMSKKVIAADKRKEKKLNSLGWKVLRFWNQEILTWKNTGMKTDSYISTILKSNGIQVLV
jgi:hypothetical protein